MMLRKKIAILTLSVGAGHVRAAEEIQRALADREDHTEARLLDAVELGSAWFRRLYVEPYWWMLRRTPGVWRRFFNAGRGSRNVPPARACWFVSGARGLSDGPKRFARPGGTRREKAGG